MHNYEIEIKSLLGSKKRADELKRLLAKHFPSLKVLPVHKQLNHYFNEPKDLKVIEKIVAPLLVKEKQKKLSHLISKVSGNVSIRTREADGKVFFIIKASIGDDSSANGVSRIEFEEPIKISLEELDGKLLKAGLSYQAKWSRERESYEAGGVHITVDKNAGYGYLAEFEKIINNETKAKSVRLELMELMEKLKCEELKQVRLERMFAHYNKHWEEYYGTNKVFTIK